MLSRRIFAHPFYGRRAANSNRLDLIRLLIHVPVPDNSIAKGWGKSQEGFARMLSHAEPWVANWKGSKISPPYLHFATAFLSREHCGQ